MNKDIDNVRVLSLTWLLRALDERGNNKFCFIIGSGTSRKSGIPTGQEMIVDWLQYLEKNVDWDELRIKANQMHKNFLHDEELCKKGTLVKSNNKMKIKHSFEEIEAAWKNYKKPNISPANFTLIYTSCGFSLIQVQVLDILRKRCRVKRPRSDIV